jgi:large subunit ribosomal protein L24
MAQQPSKYQVKFRLKKGDQVVVITGKDKGETGKIESVDKKKDRVYVTGVNIAKRHTRPTASNQEGGIVDKVMSIHVSNVMLVDPKDNKPTRVAFKTQDGKKIRYAKRSGTVLS